MHFYQRSALVKSISGKVIEMNTFLIQTEKKAVNVICKIIVYTVYLATVDFRHEN